ncbi:MAG TPA: hypothetical protein VGJ06_14560 [Candidatus Acidoferrum sp.]
MAETGKAAASRRTPYRWSADLLGRGILGMVLVLACASFASAGAQSTAAPQDAGKDACAPVQAAYQKTASVADSSSKATNTGSVNVAEAYDKITSEAGHKETCKYLRDETAAGEDANVYSDVFASKSGTANATVWISKKNGWVLKREVDVSMVGVGKGHQSIVFEYPKN